MDGGYGPIEIFWLLFVFVLTPMLALLKIATKRDQPRSFMLWGTLSWLGFAIGTAMLLTRPKGDNLPGDRDDDWAKFDLR